MEAGEGGGAELGQRLADALERASWLAQVGFAEEFVGIADDFLLHGHRQHRSVGQGQVLTDDVVERQTGAGVALAHEGMTRQTVLAQHLGPKDAVADVGLGAVAVDAGGVGAADADVVQHGCLAHKVDVKRVDGRMQVVVAHGQPHGQVGHLPAVDDQGVV